MRWPAARAGRWTFVALMACLAFLGLVVVPLGAFNALRRERIEQTFDLITLTALSSRRVVVGKLMAQAVRLTTLFAAMAPFVAMSFLLGGIDFVTIAISLVVLLMASLWVCALCVFLSALVRSRAAVQRDLRRRRHRHALRGRRGRHGVSGADHGRVLRGVRRAQSDDLADLLDARHLHDGMAGDAGQSRAARREPAVAADRRQRHASSPRIPCAAAADGRLGAHVCLRRTFRNAKAAGYVLAVLGGLHLTLVAVFAVTESPTVPRRALLRMKSSSLEGWAVRVFGPGGGRGPGSLILQLAILVGALAPFPIDEDDRRVFLASYGYLCFFVAVPTLAFRALLPKYATPLRLRVAVLVALACGDGVAGPAVLPHPAAGSARPSLFRPSSDESVSDARQLARSSRAADGCRFHSPSARPVCSR